MSPSPTSKSNSTSWTSCESPSGRLSAFATMLMSACEQLEIGIHGNESAERLKVSSDGYASARSPLEALALADTEPTTL